jgi:hypothetical protein
MRRGIFVAVLGLLFAAGGSAALAQTTTTGYQPPGCSGNTNLGQTAPGGTISGTIGPACHFTGPVTMTVNGASGGTKTPNTGNGVNVSLQVVSTTQGLLNDPVAVPVQLGSNSLSATGPIAGGATATVTGTFTVVNPAATTTTAAPAAAPTSRVAFTGANILRWSLAAAALLAIGVLMVWGSRRRRSALDR